MKRHDGGRAADRRGATVVARDRTPEVMAAMMLDGFGLALVLAVGVFLAASGRWGGAFEVTRGFQLVTLASLIGCVVTADKALLRGRTVVVDLLGAGTWALAVVLTPVAMIQKLDAAVGPGAPLMQLVLLLWLSLHGAVGVALAGVALWRQKRDVAALGLLRLWQRWLALTGVVALAFPYVLDWMAR